MLNQNRFLDNFRGHNIRPIQHKIVVEARYLPGIWNTRAAKESRVMVERHDWTPPSVLHSKSVVGPTGSGPIYFPADNTTPKVLQLATRPTGGGLGCIYPGLEQSEGICLPSFCSGGQMPQTTDRPECTISGTVSTSLAVPAVVSITELYCSTSSVTSLSRPVNPPDRNAPTRQSPTCRLAAISQSHFKAGIS